MLENYREDLNVVVVGATGGIGNALVRALLETPRVGHVYTFSRSPISEDLKQCSQITDIGIDITNEQSVAAAAQRLDGKLVDIVIVATGLLHAQNLAPEKSIKSLTAESFQAVFMSNTLGPMLVAKHFLPLLRRNQKSVFSALSARVSSISDNRLGGWYSYRASKTALNMMLKSLAIECQRTHPQAIVVGLHPGTVDTPLSKPFQKQVKPDQLFLPHNAAESLLQVIDGLTLEDSGNLFAWDAKLISP
jgi:NAD(P)-dependent dehydrogenase (short-subunit alcohol dehydrogenase family)